VDSETWTVYVRAQSPDPINAHRVREVLQASDVGGDITGFADGPLSVGLTVNVTAPTKQDGYHRVIARVHDALGPHWVVEADPAAPDD
jgi:hypothetical protein